MPAAAPLFTGGRILGTAHRYAVVPARDAYVAADAFADLVLPAVIDFFRQVRIRDGGSRASDQIEDSAAYLRDHHIGRGEAAHAHDRPFGQLLDEVDDGFVAPLGGKRRRGAIGGARMHFDVPEIRNIGEQRHHFVRLGGGVLARSAALLFHAD